MKNNKNNNPSKNGSNRRLLFQPSGLGAIFAVSVLAFSLLVTLFGTFFGGTVKAKTFEPTNESLAFASSDLSVTITDSPDPLPPGSNIRYSVEITNSGPDFATGVMLLLPIPANTTFVSLAQTSKFTFNCTTPAVGGTGNVTCTAPSFITGTVQLILTVNVNVNTPSGTVVTGSASVSSTSTDPVSGNNAATTTTTVSGSPTPTITPTATPTPVGSPTPTPTATPNITPTPTPRADLSVSISDSPDPVNAGSNLRYSIFLTNNGPGFATNVVLTIPIPANTTFVSLSSVAKLGFSCTTPAVGGTGNIVCTAPTLITGATVITLTVNVNAGTSNGTVITGSVSISSSTVDPVSGNNTATTTTTVIGGSGGGTPTPTPTPTPPTARNAALNLLDFTGDARADYVVFRPSNNFWYINPSSAANGLMFTGQAFGNAATDVLTPGDYDGDGITDLAVWRRTTGTFFVLRSSDGTVAVQQFGQNGDEPVARDYDGDGKTDYAVVRRTGGQLIWFILNSSNGSFSGEQFGVASDVVAPGDYDGDGKFDLAVFRGMGDQPATFFVRRSSDRAVTGVQFGLAGDLVVPGDYDGDGKTDYAVVRTGTSYQWYILRSSDNSMFSVQFGAKPDLPTQNDYDGDGKTDVSVYRPQNSTFYVINSSGGVTFRTFGVNGDYPVANYDTH